MPFDIVARLGATIRSVETLERDGRPATAVVAAHLYDTSADDLWQAIVDAERRRRWFGKVSGDLRQGGRYQVEGNASGTITECTPGRRIAATWEFGGAINWVEVDLTAEGDRTRLLLRHIAPVDPHWQTYGPGAVGVGWDLWITGLARHLENPAAEQPPEAIEAWFFSDEGKRAIRAASDAWGAAAIAAGDRREPAIAAAEATRQFYTGEAAGPNH